MKTYNFAFFFFFPNYFHLFYFRFVFSQEDSNNKKQYLNFINFALEKFHAMSPYTISFFTISLYMKYILRVSNLWRNAWKKWSLLVCLIFILFYKIIPRYYLHYCDVDLMWRHHRIVAYLVPKASSSEFLRGGRGKGRRGEPKNLFWKQVKHYCCVVSFVFASLLLHCLFVNSCLKLA